MRALTPQAETFCKLVFEGKMSQSECYVKAYPTAEKWTKASVQAAACNLMKRPNVQKRLCELKKKADAELVERYIWDKQKATKVLMRVAEKIEKNVDLLTKEQDDQYKDATSRAGRQRAITQNLFSINNSIKTLKEVVGELNTMYGFNKTTTEIQGAIAQVVFTGENDLPPDDESIDNNGNENLEE